jgi:archaellum biogenesis ATPase FlaH
MWKSNPASFLWLHGIPGCGKTVLSSAILQDVLQLFANDHGKAVVYFYFDFNDTQKQSRELMIRSLISQLSQQFVKMPSSLDMLFSSCKNGQRQPSLDGLLDVVRNLIREFQHVYIILDALDECTDRAELLATLQIIADWKDDALHLLVTSRKEQDIESSLENIVDTQNTICLLSELVDKDIFKYIRQRLSVDKKLNKWQKDPEIRYEIEIPLMKGAHGMYACHIVGI